MHGAKNITSFDINRLAPYGLELKWAAIQALSYEEFLSFYQNKFPLYFYNKIRLFLKENYLYFWGSLFDFTFPDTIYENLFDVENHGEYLFLQENNFSLYSKKTYYQIKEKLLSASISFHAVNLECISNQKDIVEKKYDFLYLSNIFYYLDYSSLQLAKFVLKNIKPLVKKEGEAFIHYFYGAQFSDEDLFSLFLNSSMEDIESIRQLQNLLHTNKYIVERSGYGSFYGKDVALSLKR